MVKLGGVLLASMFVLNSYGQAESREKTKAVSRVEVAPQVKQTPEEQAKAQTERLNTLLNLTSDQYAKIYESNLYVNAKNADVKVHPTWTDAQKKEAFEGNEAGRKQLIQSYLTPEQSAKYSEL